MTTPTGRRSAYLGDVSDRVVEAIQENPSAIRDAIGGIAESRLSTVPVKTGAFTASANTLVPTDASGGSFAVTLPGAAAVGSGATVVVQKLDSGVNPVTIQRSSADTINAALTSVALVLPGETYTFTSDGASKWSLSGGSKYLSTLDSRYSLRGEMVFRVGDYGGSTDKQKILNAFAAAEAAGGTRIVLLPAGVWDVGTGLSLSGYSSVLQGTGVGYDNGGNPRGSVLKATAQTGPVLDLNGWLFPANFLGRQKFSNFAIQGDGTADATLAKTGLALATTPNSALGSVSFEDIAITKTGGPALDFGRVYFCDFTRIVLGQPVGVQTNNVPWMRTRGMNGNRFIGLGLRSLSASGDVAAVGAIDMDSDMPGNYASTANMFIGTWFEFLHVPTNGTMWSIRGNENLIDGTWFVDCSKEVGATGTSFYRLDVPSYGNNYGGNMIRGIIPGSAGGLYVDTGVDVRQNRNRIDGIRAFNGSNVTIAAGVDYTYAHIGGAESGVPGNAAYINNSTAVHNVLIDSFGGYDTIQNYRVKHTGTGGPQFENLTTPTVGAVRLGNTGCRIESGTGSPEGLLAAPVGTIYLRLDGTANATEYRKESGTGNTGWVPATTGGTAPNVQTFTGNGTWTKPTNATVVEVTLIAGGGGGGSGRKGLDGTIRCGGGAGSGGGFTKVTIPASALPSTVAVTVGAAGAGGVAQTADSTNGNSGSVGGATTFAGFVKAWGGLGGGGGTATTGTGGASTPGTSPGGSGASASTTGGVGVGATTNAGPIGGCSGGGITSGNVASNGGSSTGTGSSWGLATAGSAGTVDTTTPTDGGNAPTGLTIPGAAGGGGASSITTAAQAGAAGGLYGVGGSGGGAGKDAVGNSGAGGSGAAGIAQIVTYF